MENDRDSLSGLPAHSGGGLNFAQITPTAPLGLGGLLRDHFSNGRLTVTVGWHGGLANVAWWGRQHLVARDLFQGGLESEWHKLFRTRVGVNGQPYCLPLTNTKLYPFGYGGPTRLLGVDFQQELLLLPNAIVQRIKVLRNAKALPLYFELLHHQIMCRYARPIRPDSGIKRVWSDFRFDDKLGALIGRCLDTNPDVYTGEGDSLSQQGLGLVVRDAPRATTWFGIGCDHPAAGRIAHNGFKVYLTSEPLSDDRAAIFVVFAHSRKALIKRLKELSKTVHRECDDLLAGYETRLKTRPRVDVGHPALNSAFGQYPEIIHSMKVPDRPGAVRAAQLQYFVWGWDGMTPLASCPLANEPEYAADILRFFHSTWHPKIGLPLQFTSNFKPRLKEPYPAQAQYLGGLYHYIAATGDLEVARQVMPTCRKILDRCRQHVVKDTGMVAINALWPDVCEAMGENGKDISSLNNSLLYQGLRSMEYVAMAIGDARMARDCRNWASVLRANFIKYLYDEEKGYFITSCSAKDFSPRKHYGCQAVFWMTPFARELVSHAPRRIAAFMHEHLRSAKCLLSVPRWDASWMADGNQIGASYPTADYLYLNVHKMIGDARALKAWMGDVEWFWRYHTVPEEFTPESVNEDWFGPNNHGGKQLQTLSAWYTCAYSGLAGLDIDHEGLTITPWGDIPVAIRGVRLRGTSVDLTISGAGSHVQSLKLNGKALPVGSRKIPWQRLQGRSARIELVRGTRPPEHPVLVHADGLRIADLNAGPRRLTARVTGEMSGEVLIQAKSAAQVCVNGQTTPTRRDPATGMIIVPYADQGPMDIQVMETKGRLKA